MTLPAGVVTKTVTISVPLDTFGNPAKAFSGTIRPDRSLIWEATGEPIWGVDARLPDVVDGKITFEVPPVDQPGMITADGDPVTFWSYDLHAAGTWSHGRRSVSKNFQVLAATVSPLDLDLVPNGMVTPPVLGRAYTASEISFAPAGTIGATTVQAAVVEVATDAAGALAAHEADTTGVHGIADTSLLETQAGAQAKANAAAAASVAKALVDAKGDLLVGSADNTAVRLPVGATNSLLFADSGQSSGLRWGAAGELPKCRDLAGVDLNTVVTPGSYLAGTTCTNGPFAGTAGQLVVGAQSSGVNVMQTFALLDADRVFIRRTTNSGAAWGAWIPVRTGAAFAGNTITGSGSPEGVVTAPVGTEYNDTAVTLGVAKWIKTSGTGNTGWRVVFGDTGWRDITSLLAAGTLDAANTGTFSVRRENATVSVRVSNLLLAAGTGTLTLLNNTLPDGFRSAVAFSGKATRSNNATLEQNFWQSGASVSWLSEATLTGAATNTQVRPSISLTGTWSYQSISTAWPSALPGTPG